MRVTPDTPAVTTPAGAIPAPRVATDDTTVPPATPTTPAAAVDVCRCGHERDAHEHYRPGTDCGACGTACRAFHARAARPGGRPARLVSRLFHRS